MFSCFEKTMRDISSIHHRCRDTFLDMVHLQILDGSIVPAMDALRDGLLQRKTAFSRMEWKRYVQVVCLNHPISELLRRDPITDHSVRKPRGYAGDAELLDMIYGLNDWYARIDQTDQLGRSLSKYNANSIAARAVRHRRELLARLIDEAAKRVHRPRILSIAAGHLREIELSDAAQRQALGSYVALDQDAESLKRVMQDYGHLGVRTVHQDVARLISSGCEPNYCDFVYAAGLFDYLSRASAAALAKRMFDFLRPGGQILIANFRCGIRDAAYLDSFMQWPLIYRTSEGLRGFVSEIDSEEIEAIEQSEDHWNCIMYLLVTKKRSAEA